MPPPRESAWRRWGLPAVLLVVTAFSVFFSGALYPLGDVPGIGPVVIFDSAEGLSLAIGLMSILFAHEMGHYLACRYYRVNATLPNFLPGLWIPFAWPAFWQAVPFVGTFGAFIRIRAPIPHRRALFDIGVAGPLAGFVVCLPVLILGVAQGQVAPAPDAPSPFNPVFGEPLLFQWVSRAVHGPIPDGFTLYIGQLGIAAWFGLFVTALNLMPIGQLDGGHITYAILKKRAWGISQVGSWLCVALIYFGPTWILWAVLVRILGRRHPPTLNEHVPIGRGRVIVGWVALAVFVVCFVPNPLVVSWRDIFAAFGLTLP